jgi:hypothetical protein
MSMATSELQVPLRRRTFGLLILVILAPSLGALAALWWWPGSCGSAIYSLCKLVLYGVPTVVAWRTITRAQLVRGLRAGVQPAALLWGIGSGGMLGAVILVGWFGFVQGQLDLAALREVVNANGLDEPVRYWTMAIWLSVGNALLEEFVFRWFVDSRLKQLGLWIGLAIPISALIFTAHHVLVLMAYFPAVETILFSLGVFVGGLLWSWLLRRHGSLVPGYLSHILVDLALFVVGASMLFGS